MPLYALHAVDAKMSLEETLEIVDILVADNDHFEFFWFPHTTTALTRRFRRLPGNSPLRPRNSFGTWVDDRLVTNFGLDALLRVGAHAPRTVPAITRLVTAAVSAREFTELAPSVFASNRDVRFVEGEYAVPRAVLVDVLRELRLWVERNHEPVWPTLPGSDAKGTPLATHPFLLWWAVLYGISHFVRYEPAKWADLVDVDVSHEAVALEEIGDVALDALPELIHKSLVRNEPQ